MTTTGVGAVSRVTSSSYRVQVVWQGPLTMPELLAQTISVPANEVLVDPFFGPKSGVALIEPLTPRERDVLRLVAEAANNGEIADELGISLRTVETHLASIYGKLGVRGRLEAVLWAVGTGIEAA